MQTWKLTIAYDGRKLCGWQAQAGVRTVQVELEVALRQLFGGENIVAHGSGRTDSGVHALGQVVSFRAERPRDPGTLAVALNSLLPSDISCLQAAHAPAGFHARFSATGKTYRYLLLESPVRSPFWTGLATRVRYPIDWSAFDQALADYLGTHDFTAFQGPQTDKKRSPIRTISRSERTLEAGPHGVVHAVTFEGPGFLRYQLRIMVGTALEIGFGRRSPTSIRELLALGPDGSRAAAGKTAPPDGLYLVEVRHRQLAPTQEYPRRGPGRPWI